MRLSSPSSSAPNITFTLFLHSLFCPVPCDSLLHRKTGVSRWVIRASGWIVGSCCGGCGFESLQAMAGPAPESPAISTTRISPPLPVLGFLRKWSQNCSLAQTCWLCWDKSQQSPAYSRQEHNIELTMVFQSAVLTIPLSSLCLITL